MDILAILLLVFFVIVAILLGLLVWSTVAWADAKARYTDGTTAATALDADDED